MKRLTAMLLLVGALSATAVIAQAHGPGGGTLWSGMPWAGVVHTHCTTAANANDFYVTVAGQSVGVGKHSQNPAVVDYYVIAPVTVGSLVHPPVPGNTSPCLDSIIP